MDHEPANLAHVTMIWCPSCGGEIAANLLSCPSCHRLVHADRLKELAGAAEAAERAGESSGARASWQEALALLPPESRQHAAIADRVARLGRQVEAGPAPKKAVAPGPNASPDGPSTASRWSGGAISGIAGAAVLAVMKFKFLAAFLIFKAKFLLLGLTKASTFFSMLAAFGVYWTQFGVSFALGFVLSIYVHEMGHVAALLRYGVKASAALFLPGIGAVIRLKQGFIDPAQDARVGLAGPIWGLGAAAFCAVIHVLTDEPLWAALARVGAWVNLFNLMPIWQLDGGRAFRGLNRPQRWLAVTAISIAWAATSEGLLVLLMIVGAGRALVDKPADKPDPGVLFQFIALVAALSALVQLPVS